MYLENLSEELEGSKSFSELLAVIDENIPEKHIQMKYKMKSILTSLDKNKMIDVSVPEYPSYLKIKGDNHPNYPLQIFLQRPYQELLMLQTFHGLLKMNVKGKQLAGGSMQTIL